MAIVLQQLDVAAQLAVHRWVLRGLEEHRDPLNSLASALGDTVVVDEETLGDVTTSEAQLMNDFAPVSSSGLGTVLFDTWKTVVAGIEAADGSLRLHSVYERTHEVLQRAANDWLYNPTVSAGVNPQVREQVTSALLTWSLLFRSFSENAQNTDVVNGERFAISLEVLLEKLEAQTDIAVTDAEAGSLGAVVSTLADAALNELDGGSELVDIIVNSTDAALSELERGPVKNELLSEYGIVDPAAASLLVLMDQFISVTSGAVESAQPVRIDRGDRAASPSIEEHGHESICFTMTCHLYPHEGATVETLSWVESQLWDHVDTLSIDFGERSKVKFLSVDLTTFELGAVIELIAQLGELREVAINVAQPASELS